MSREDKRTNAPWLIIAVLGAAIVVALGIRSLQLTSPASGASVDPSWCNGGQPGFHLSLNVGVQLLGMRAHSEEETQLSESEPLWDTACQVAWDLWGLTDAESAWCADEQNRETYLAPAIPLLGLGESEAAASDAFGEAPGDSPAEYVQACKYAIGHLAGDQLTTPNLEGDPFFELSPEQAQWCDQHPDARLGIAAGVGLSLPPNDGSAELTFAGVLSCRVAFAVEGAKGIPRATDTIDPQPEDPSFVLEVTYRNASSTDVRIRESSSFGSSQGVLQPCAISTGMAAHQGPVELSFSTAEDAYETFHTVSGELDISAAALEVTFEHDGSVTVREVASGAPVSELECEE